MKILFFGYRNPDFITVTEYSERAFKAAGAEVDFFCDRSFYTPGTIRRAIPPLDNFELRLLNRRLLAEAAKVKPDAFLACGGTRVLPATLTALREMGITTVLWTTDAFSEVSLPLLSTAPMYDRIFCGGTEAIEVFTQAGIGGAKWLPFACDPEIHGKPVSSTAEDGSLACDLCFVGSVHPALYPDRVKLLESISDFNLKVWGPGAETIPETSPLRKRVSGGKLRPELWLRAYSSAKIVLCMHYADPAGKYPCYQASPRVYEALACGAFLLCDAQKDVLSLFEDGRHLAIFRDAAELRKKIEYYLANSEEREAIAREGRNEVLKKHTYLDRVRVVLESLKMR